MISTDTWESVSLNKFVLPMWCAASQHHIAVDTSQQVTLLTRQGTLIQTIHDSQEVQCAAFHPELPLLLLGLPDGSVRIWDVNSRQTTSSFKDHAFAVSRIRIGPTGHVFVSSIDGTASVVSLDDKLAVASSVKLSGHFDDVYDIIPLTDSSKCVTCSKDTTVFVWDYQTGEQLRTFTDHTEPVMALALSSSGSVFASGSDDGLVVIRSSETLEVVRQIQFEYSVSTLVFGGNDDTVLVGVIDHGVYICSVRTGETSLQIPLKRASVPSFVLRECLC
jgi:WD40 repeat protein